ncbi:MAG: hypothetical protein PHD95_03615 [Candidatus ainarchaeum sp.]|nr:hypothetical protein [Candidatus ainarchaeum sp.]
MVHRRPTDRRKGLESFANPHKRKEFFFSGRGTQVLRGTDARIGERRSATERRRGEEKITGASFEYNGREKSFAGTNRRKPEKDRRR